MTTPLEISSRSRGATPRIVSLVPSWTASIWDLGLGHSLVGKTRFCSYPYELRLAGIPSVGGTKDVRVGRVLGLAPDLVITNDEENPPTTIAELTDRLGPDRVLRTYPKNPAEAAGDLQRLADIAGASPKSSCEWLSAIDREHHELHEARETLQFRGQSAPEPTGFIYLIWMNPWMAAGNRSYISGLLAEGGFINLVDTGDDPKERYPVITPESEYLKSGTRVTSFVFLSSEPFAFRARHADTVSAEWNWPRSHIMLVDGRALSWYGTRLVEGYREVKKLLVACGKVQASR